MALTTDVVVARPKPHTVETTTTPSRYSVSKASCGSSCLSSNTARVSTTMNEAATTIPKTSDGAVGRLNTDSKHARIDCGPTRALDVRPAKMRPDIHAQPGTATASATH